MRPLLLLLAGCACPPPSIDGGSAWSREQVEAALHDFFLGVGEGAVCIDEIRFRDIRDPEVGGAYIRLSHTILIEEGPWDLSIPVTHEMCHAYSRQHDLDLSNEETWRLVTRDSLWQHKARQESFAYTCQIGPESAQLIGRSCPDDPPGAEAFTFLLDVYTEPFPGVLQRQLVQETIASTLLPGAEELGIQAEGAHDSTLRLALKDDSLTIYVDIWTGERTTLSTFPAKVEALEFQGMDVLSHASTGEESMMLVRAIAANGATVHRLLYQDEDGISRAGCPHPGEQVFAAEGALWSAWPEGDEVHWGRWTPAE